MLCQWLIVTSEGKFGGLFCYSNAQVTDSCPFGAGSDVEVQNP
jgi:hypothetical protein